MINATTAPGRRRLPAGFARLVHRLPVVSLTVAVAALVLVGVPPAMGHLRYSPAAFAAGEWWRVLSCHVVHWSTDHALWDALAFALAGSLAERIDRCGMLLTVGVAALVIPPLVLAAMPGLGSYAGLSGLDVALYAFALTRITRMHWPEGNRGTRAGLALAGVGLVAKIAFELLTGQLLFVHSHETSFVPVPLAHLLGGLVGLVVGLGTAGANLGKALPPAERIPDRSLYTARAGSPPATPATMRVDRQTALVLRISAHAQLLDVEGAVLRSLREGPPQHLPVPDRHRKG